MNANLIVVAHDHPATVHALITAFAAAGYEAAGALTFRDAADLIAECRPALLVVNLELGAYNGLHLAVRAAADCPEIKTVVIGPATAVVEEEALALGASAYVPRPASLEAIIDHALAVVVDAAPAVVTHAVAHA